MLVRILRLRFLVKKSNSTKELVYIYSNSTEGISKVPGTTQHGTNLDHGRRRRHTRGNQKTVDTMSTQTFEAKVLSKF